MNIFKKKVTSLNFLSYQYSSGTRRQNTKRENLKTNENAPIQKKQKTKNKTKSFEATNSKDILIGLVQCFQFNQVELL